MAPLTLTSFSHTLWDSIAFEISARKTLPFGNLENIYVSLDTVKVYATEWTNECDLMVRKLVRDDPGNTYTKGLRQQT